MMNALCEYVKQNGGATFNLMTGEYPSTGFMVAKAENEFILDGECTVDSLYAYMARDASDLQKDDAHLGIWYNTDNGKTYLDTSYRFENIDEALEFARANHQLAIFDLATFNEIRL